MEHVIVTDKNSNQAAAPPPKGAQSPRITQDHPGSPRLARASPASRDHKAALTLDLVEGEVGADFCHLGFQIWTSISESRRRIRNPAQSLNHRMRRVTIFRCNPAWGLRAIRVSCCQVCLAGKSIGLTTKLISNLIN